jgi:hypothetical protein
MRVSAKFNMILLSAALAAGCATRFQPPDHATPHARLAFPSQHEQHATGMYLEPLEFNGALRPRYWTQDEFRVPAGELRLLVRAARENQQAACPLSFPVAAGETYELGARAGEEDFTIHASRDGHVVAECVGPSMILPTPLRLPGVVSAR